MDASEHIDPDPTGSESPQQDLEPGLTPEIVDITDPQQRPEALRRAAALLKEGECVVLPTDTVYGIGADALDPIAVQRLLMAKGRGRDMPPPVLIGDAAVLPALCDRVPDAAKALADAHWPGGLTLIFHAQQDLTMDLGETNETIAVRVPDQDATRQLLRITGPLAVSSANKSGSPAALTAQNAADQLGISVALYLDGGPSRIGEASTIIDFASGDEGKVLRQGALSIEDIHLIAPDVVPLAQPETPDPAPETDPEPADGPSQDADPVTTDQPTGSTE